MDNQRLLIWATFVLIAWMTYTTWMADYGPRPAPAVASEQATAPAAGEDNELPELGVPDIVAPAAETSAPSIQTNVEPDALATTIRVLTDVLDVEISSKGGTLQSATLLSYPVAKDQPDTLVQLLSPERLQLGLIRTGLRLPNAAIVDHNAEFSTSREFYELGSAEQLVVPLRWQNEQGIVVEKRFVFRPGSYAIELQQEVLNNSAAAVRADAYSQIVRRSYPLDRSMFDVDSYSFDGPIVFNGEKAEKLDRDDLFEDGAYEYSSNDGWLGVIQHHFVSAIVPPAGSNNIFQVKGVQISNVTQSSIISAAREIAPGQSETFELDLFVGPKMQSQLEELHPRLKLTVDYGWLTLLSQPLFWLLSTVYGFVANWGVAIIVVTILIKLAFYKLTESSGRSMAKMRNLQPRMKALQERYKDDKPQLNQAMMDLYKREQVNPVAGCLPILIQMPFFLAFYWVLLESVEMRQAPFALWITDLSSKDPYFILPLIMGVAMFFQQKLNPTSADPVHARVMQIMPVIFTAFFAFFPAGLVLYWVTNTLLSIAQQWKINTVVERESKEEKNRNSKKKD